MTSKFHPLSLAAPKPPKFTYPFQYEPHPLCLAAAEEVCRCVEGDALLRADAARGKMFGVLVAEAADGRPGFLAAYSGLLCGRNDHAFFVPPVFDAMRPDGHFKLREAEITVINRRINEIEASPKYANAAAEQAEVRRRCAAEEEAFRQKMQAAKAGRDARRASAEALTADDEAAMVRESQFMKAELRRLRQRNAALMAQADEAVEAVRSEISALKSRRKSMSDELQRWLFSQYSMLNSRGERRDLCSIFAETPQRVPPSGAGDCCAPKLLQYAYLNGLHPLCMAEFWWGSSPVGEVRHHLRFYPSCRGKCLPILGHMLQGLDVEEPAAETTVTQPLEVVYEDEWLAVVCKPAGMLSVPGKSGADSVLSLMRERSHRPGETLLAHRLDMDTSGLLLVAYGMAVYKDLQAQFAGRRVKKRYVALLDGAVSCPQHGLISLPMCPDPLDRPYQKVDLCNGKEAVTEYRLLETTADATRVALFPHTGRTHQLRVHCAHADGLGVPIKGDRLYGHSACRLCLHAEAITFTHPVTGKTMTFRREADF